MAVKIVLGVIANLLFATAFFLCAGRFDWVRGWVFLALLASGQGLSSLFIWRRNPEVLKHRGRLGPGTRKWDVVLLTLFGLAYVAIMITGAVDERFGGGAIPLWLWPLGAGLYLSNQLLITWAMTVNAHFEKSVRLQTDRGHKVIDTGPYRFIRHPGYAATIFGFVSSPPLLLGSWWAFVPAGAAALILVIRTALEDRLLRRELPGYEAYARRVRFRLLLGVW
jgi:protein-S-isoprenylcysteine O-methyltransferase Ste14